jgi:enterochelin esterase-like enzyme
MQLPRAFVLQAAFLIACVSPVSAQAQSVPQLHVGQVQDGALKSGKSDSYALALNAGDFVETNVVTHGTRLLLTIYDPSGNKARGFGFGGPGRSIAFVAESSGKYRLEVSLGPGATDGPYTFTLTRIVSWDDSKQIAAKEKYQSPRIAALRAAVNEHQKGAVEDFWKEIHASGAPVVEPLKDDPQDMLVTFLYQGSAGTRSVLIGWEPYNYLYPDDYRMIQIAGTDVWYRTLKVDSRERFAYQLGPNAPPLFSSREPYPDDFASHVEAAMQGDILNPKRLPGNPNSPDVPVKNDVSLVEMPNAPAQPWAVKREGVPEGTVTKQQFGSDLLKNQREIAVYTPPGYSRDREPYGVMVIFDERQYLDDTLAPAPTILDNLIADHRIPAIVAILVDNPDGKRTQELTCNREFSDFLSSELLPWARRTYNVTTDPRQTIVAGSSYGGLAAACAGLFHSETFGNVLSQSGSFHWTPTKSNGSVDPVGLDSTVLPDYVAQQFIASPRLPVRFYMDAGTEEIDQLNHAGLPTSRLLRAVLVAKGYEVHYQEFHGSHNFRNWRGTLSDGLIALTKNSPSPTSPPK